MARILPPTRSRTKVLVSGTISAGAVSITLTSGQGALLPDPATEGEYRLVLYDASTYPDPTNDPNCEDITVTGKSTDTLTVDPVVNNHTTIGVQYVMYLSFDKDQIDLIDRILGRQITSISSIVYNAKRQVTSVVCGTVTYTLTYNDSGRIATINDGTNTCTITYNGVGNVSSISYA